MDNSIVEKIVKELAHSLPSLVKDNFDYDDNCYDIGVEIVHQKIKNVDYIFSRSKECAHNEKAVKINEFYDIYPGDFILSIGCLMYPLDFWKRNYKKIGMSYGMSDFEISIYKYIIDLFINLENQSRKYFK